MIKKILIEYFQRTVLIDKLMQHWNWCLEANLYHLHYSVKYM